MSKSFTLPLRIYVYDTDYGGIVYHANYLKYMDRARTEWLAAEGFTLEKLAAQQLHFVVRSVQIDYRRPARLNTMLEIDSCVTHIGKTSLTFTHIARNQTDKENIFCQAEIKLVCINDSLKPIAVPPLILEKLT